MSPSADQLRAGAEAASAALPALMLSAERLAASLTAGAHGQRRAGAGEDFWQYRPATQGDTARSIDWRRSARSDGQFVRDREAQAAQSAVLWVSAAAGMDFSGGADRPAKRDRAALLALALALGLLAGGERVALAGQPPRPGRMQADRIAEALVARAPLPADEDTPPAEALRPGQRSADRRSRATRRRACRSRPGRRSWRPGRAAAGAGPRRGGLSLWRGGAVPLGLGGAQARHPRRGRPARRLSGPAGRAARRADPRRRDRRLAFRHP
nr:DUF58 domain-containing protein [Paracoccus mutanolyticus]